MNIQWFNFQLLLFENWYLEFDWKLDFENLVIPALRAGVVGERSKRFEADL